MTLSNLGLFAAALLVNCGTPGPSIAALVARVISSGARSVLPFLCALWIGEIMWLVGAVMGLATVARELAWLLIVIKFAGIGYLLIVAWSMWWRPAEPHGSEIPTGTSAVRLFFTGLAITLGNPKLVLFYLALLPTIVDLKSITPANLSQLVVVCLAIMAFTDLTWIGVANWARRLFRSARAVRISNRISAGVLGAAAIAIAAK